MPEKLPHGWIKTTLGDIAELSRERALPAEAPDMPYVGLEHIEPHTMRLLGHDTARNVRSSSIRFSNGDVLYGKMRPYLNKVWVADFDGLCSAEFLVFPKSVELNSLFLAFRLNAKDFVEFANQQVSGERPRVGFEKLSRFPILLPSAAEQKRIVEKLKNTLAAVQRAEKAAQRAHERLQRYRIAVLYAAVSGELTRVWREKRQKDASHETGEALLSHLLAVRRSQWEKEELRRLHPTGKSPKDDKWKGRYREPIRPKTTELPTLPDNWTWASIDQVSTRVTVGHVGPMKNEYVRSGIPFLRSQNVRVNRFDPQGLLFIRPQFHARLLKSRILPGDVVVVRSGSVGTTCVIPEDIGEANCSDLVIIQRPLIEPHFIAFYMNSAAKKHVEAGKVGVALTHFNTASVAALTISLPPRVEQQEILREVLRRFAASDRLQASLEEQLARAATTRQSLLHEAFSGTMVPQNPKDEPATLLLARLLAEKARKDADRKEAQRGHKRMKKNKAIPMQSITKPAEMLRSAWQKIGKKPDAGLLFNEAGFVPGQVFQFYEALRAVPEIRAAFQKATQEGDEHRTETKRRPERPGQPKGRFRLLDLWLEDFKNLRDYEVTFNPAQAVDVVLGWNGTGKSNLFEALVIIFRDLHEWWERNRWTDKPMNGFRLSYEIDEYTIQVTWLPKLMKRPELKKRPVSDHTKDSEEFQVIKREQLPLPRFVFGYYSGPTNRLAEQFLPMKQAHYVRLRDAESDDSKTLSSLLEQRRFFCAETHHAKYVLLSFCYREDAKISEFLHDRLRIAGFESALFVVRKPEWFRNNDPNDFWGARGVMRRVLKRLQQFAIAPLVLQQSVKSGFRSITEDHYYFLLPDRTSLQNFAAEYDDARTFFLALESTDFSELIHDVKVQVRIKATPTEEVPITFQEMSEGEQQLLMVLGLMRFTKSDQSLILLDEPDTHLNPHWSMDYLKLLSSVMSNDGQKSSEQQSSQILVTTHDPLVIASLEKEQIHLLKRDPDGLNCYWEQPLESPRGMGYSGILMSDMFGFRSDLDFETLALLDKQAELATKDGPLSKPEREKLENVNREIDKLGFKSISSDPYYREFLEAMARNKTTFELLKKETRTRAERETIQKSANEILAKLGEKHSLDS